MLVLLFVSASQRWAPSFEYYLAPQQRWTVLPMMVHFVPLFVLSLLAPSVPDSFDENSSCSLEARFCSML